MHFVVNVLTLLNVCVISYARGTYNELIGYALLNFISLDIPTRASSIVIYTIILFCYTLHESRISSDQ